MITTGAAINIFQARSCWWKNQRAFIFAKKNCGKIKDQFNLQLSVKPPCSFSPGTNILFSYTQTLNLGLRKYYVLRLEVKSTAEVMEWLCKIYLFTKHVLPSWNYYDKEKVDAKFFAVGDYLEHEEVSSTIWLNWMVWKSKYLPFCANYLFFFNTQIKKVLPQS